MRRRSLLLATVAISLSAELPAAAQSISSNTAPVEVTPWMSFGSYPSSRYGVGVLFPVTPRLSVEGEVGFRLALFNEMSATASIVSPLPRIGRVTTYLAVGAGIEQYVRDILSPIPNFPFTEKAVAFAINAGGGVKVPIDDRWSVRADARLLTAFNGPEHWRFYSGVTMNVGR